MQSSSPSLATMDRAEVRVLSAGKSRWRVLEVLGPGAPHLLLCSASSVRTIRPYPPNWRFMPDEDLYALSAPVAPLWS